MKTDAYWLERNNAMGMYCVAHGLLLWMGTACLSALAWGSHWPLALRIAAVAACTLVSGMGMFYVTTLSHEGFHGCLNRNRYVSMAMGVVAASAVPFFGCVGYTVRHWHHHLYTNTPQDPDFADSARYPSFWSRASQWALRSNVEFARNVFCLLFAPERVELRHYPFSLPVARAFALLNVTAILVYIVLYALLARVHPQALVFGILLPSIVAATYLGIVPFIDHAQTGTAKGENARSYTSPLFTALLMGTNYHREHHLHPSVPSYKLVGLHRHYRNAGALPSLQVVEPGFWAALKIGATQLLNRRNATDGAA